MISDKAESVELTIVPLSATNVITTVTTTLKEEVAKTELTAAQKMVLATMYVDVKETVEKILTVSSVSDIVRIAQSIAEIIKRLEATSLVGADKKRIALELTRDLIKDVLHSDSVLAIYDAIAEDILETMVDVSRTLNVVEEAAEKACVSCFSSK